MYQLFSSSIFTEEQVIHTLAPVHDTNPNTRSFALFFTSNLNSFVTLVTSGGVKTIYPKQPSAASGYELPA